MGHSGNSLDQAASSYLRSAVHQPVNWHQWGAEAFERAKREDKPVLLDIGAVWCHWCHVMDRESYEDPELAAIVNEHFVAIKVDRDERPDVDSRYQAAVQSISGQGGWPLTAFLTPDGRPYFGGTYFPRGDRYGRPGFERVLLTMADVWKTRRDEAVESADSVFAAIEHGEAFDGREGSLSLGIVDKLLTSTVGQFDPRHGGFGSQPKFPHPAMLDLLIDAAGRTGDEAARQAATVTLARMACGGVYDQLAGGFHRYSTDERWVVPHFEKMLYDNAGLLANYVHAFQSFADADAAKVARDIIRWLDEVMTDRERGGFYASQDADLSLDDDGDYFTWTADEASAALTPEEFAIASAYYDIGEIGEMHHNPAKNVLHVRGTLESVAKSNGVPLDAARERLVSARTKLYAARLKRPTPYVDKTIYVGWNGMMISAYLEAGRVLDLPEARAFALKSLDRVLAESWNPETGMAHVVAYGEPGSAGARVAGVLEDYVFVAHAALDAWEATGEMRYYEAAAAIAESVVARFYDKTGCGFFDMENAADGEVRLGALSARRKPLQDSPTPAGNPVAAALLMRLEGLSGREDYAVKSLDTMEAFAGVVEHFGLFAATYALALQRMVQRAVQICVIGDDADARRLEAVALARFAVNKSVIRLRRDQLGALPPALAETLPHLPGLKAEGSFAAICNGKGCLPPVSTVDELIEAMNRAL